MGIQGPCVICALMPGRCEGGDGIGANPAERDGRWPGSGNAERSGSHRSSCRSARIDHRVRRVAAVDVAIYRAARVFLRQGDAGGDAHVGAEDISASAFAVAALPPRSPYWRRYARDRPGYSRYFIADQLYFVLDLADADRDHAGVCLSAVELRNLVCRHRRDEFDHLHRIHGVGDQLAYRCAATLERAREQGAFTCR